MESVQTTDHDEIRAWIEEHGGKPAIRDKRENNRGVLDICFDELHPDFQLISWDEFFDTFDSLNMIFRYECLNDTCSEYAYTLLHQNESTPESGLTSENEMPEDVPIENVIPSASATPSPDNQDKRMRYG